MIGGDALPQVGAPLRGVRGRTEVGIPKDYARQSARAFANGRDAVAPLPRHTADQGWSALPKAYLSSMPPSVQSSVQSSTLHFPLRHTFLSGVTSMTSSFSRKAMRLASSNPTAIRAVDQPSAWKQLS